MTQHPALLQRYLSSNDESRLSRVQAGFSSLPALGGGQNHAPPTSSARYAAPSSYPPSLGTTTLPSFPSAETPATGESLWTTQQLLEEDPNGILQAPQRLTLQCPFYFLQCTERFATVDDWWHHSVLHFCGLHPPTTAKCFFCDKIFESADKGFAWRWMMLHMHSHLQGGLVIEHAPRNMPLIEYLWNKRTLSLDVYRQLKTGGCPFSGQISPRDPTARAYVATYSPLRDRRAGR